MGRTEQELWKIAKRYYSSEESHGLPHVKGVYSNFKEWIGGFPAMEDIAIPVDTLPPLVPKISRALEAAVIFHDIGHRDANGKPHALVSAEKLLKMKAEIGKFLSAEEIKWLLYAVRNHSQGGGKLKYGAGQEKEFCLALLVVFDHMEGIGATGIYRTIKDFGGKVPLYRMSARKKIVRLIEHPEEIKKISKSEMVESSILEHLTYNYCVTDKILGVFSGDEKTEKILPPAVRKEVRQRQKIMREFILSLLKNNIMSDCNDAIALFFNQNRFFIFGGRW